MQTNATKREVNDLLKMYKTGAPTKDFQRKKRKLIMESSRLH